MYTTRLTPPAPYRTVVTARGKGLQLAGASRPVTVTRVTQGLRGEPGSSAAAPASRLLTWDAERIAGVTFSDGRSKTFAWAGDRLAHVDSASPDRPTLRSALSYTPDGLIESITVSQLP